MPRTFIVGEHAEDVAGALRVLGGGTAVQTKGVVRRARSSAGSATHVVLFLTERDNVAELRDLLSTSSAAFLLVAPASPPRAALARIARQYRAALCARGEPAPLRDATMIAFTASRPEYAVP
jgi:hypothetical protein